MNAVGEYKQPDYLRWFVLMPLTSKSSYLRQGIVNPLSQELVAGGIGGASQIIASTGRAGRPSAVPLVYCAKTGIAKRLAGVGVNQLVDIGASEADDDAAVNFRSSIRFLLRQLAPPILRYEHRGFRFAS